MAPASIETLTRIADGAHEWKQQPLVATGERVDIPGFGTIQGTPLGFDVLGENGVVTDQVRHDDTDDYGGMENVRRYKNVKVTAILEGVTG